VFAGASAGLVGGMYRRLFTEQRQAYDMTTGIVGSKLFRFNRTTTMVTCACESLYRSSRCLCFSGGAWKETRIQC
jgi:hypothetical protein